MNRSREADSDSQRRSGMRDRDMGKKKDKAAGFRETGANRLRTPKQGLNVRIEGSSLRSYRRDDDEEELARPDQDSSLRVAGFPLPARRHFCDGSEVSDSDLYLGLRVADDPLRSSDLVIGMETLKSRNDGRDKGPYASLKIATGDHINLANGDELVYDPSDSYSTEEDADDLDEQVDSDVVSEDFPTSCAKISVSGSQDELRKDDGRLSVKGKLSVAGGVEHGMNTSGAFSSRVADYGDAEKGQDGYQEIPAHSRVSAAGSEGDHEQLVNAKFCRAGSENDHEQLGSAKFCRAWTEGVDDGKEIYARLSVAGSEVGDGKEIYARLSVAGSEIDNVQDVYAKLSIAGSESDHDNDVDSEYTGYSRVPVAGIDVSRRMIANATVYSPLSDFRRDSMHVSKEYRLSDHDSMEALQTGSGKEARMLYEELSPEIRAKLQYRVRVLLISPLFEINGRKLSAFPDLYRSKFGEDVELTGFSSALTLCRVMPNVVQWKNLEDNGVLVLVDSSENRRAVSGIRSGLRRILYDCVKSFPSKCTCYQLEQKMSELLGAPLGKVLSEHGYNTPILGSMLMDMLDIVGLDNGERELCVYLCPEAEDPALSDGLLIKSTPLRACRNAEIKDVISEAEDVRDSSTTDAGHLSCQQGNFKFGSSLTLRSLRNELKRFGNVIPASASSTFDRNLLVRLQMRILLAFHNSGRGVQAQDVPELYARAFCSRLDLHELGFKTLIELARCWQDIFLLQDPRPGWLFLVPSQANRRILNALRTGLRFSVFSVLRSFSEGLDPVEFLHRLQEGMFGELFDVLSATGYTCSHADKEFLSSCSKSDVELVEFQEVIVLLDDLMDFVRLGSDDDGSVVIKLRNGDVPLVDLQDCKMGEVDIRSFDELFVNLMMIVVDDTNTSAVDDEPPDSSACFNVGHVQSLVRSFEGNGLRSTYTQAHSLKLKHELRLILGCPQYFETGLAWNELNDVYRDRTGEVLGSTSKVKSLLRAMPDVVCKNSLLEDTARLLKSPKNLRILSVTRAGLRQVLFWASVKSPGGIWTNLLEGWFTDFAGVSLVTALQMHGYELSQRRPLFPVQVFLRDMTDLLQKPSDASFEIYTWTDAVKDPVHTDAILMGLSELKIQYYPVEWDAKEVLNVQIGKEAVTRPAFSGNEVDEQTDQCISEELKGKFAGLEDEVARESFSEEPLGLKARLNQRSTQKIPEEKENLVKVRHVQSRPEDAVGFTGLEGAVDNEVQLHHHQRPTEQVDRKRIAFGFAKGGETMHRGSCGIEADMNFREADFFESDVSMNASKGDLNENRPELSSGAYVQVRVSNKGPTINLDEWQFTDSEAGEESDTSDCCQEEEGDEGGEDEDNKSLDVQN